MEIIFNKLPESLEELKQSAYGNLEKPEYTAALFLVSMCLYPKNKDEALKMIEYLKGPSGLSEYEKQFIRDRVNNADYVAISYFKGTSVENNYTPTVPYTVNIESDKYSYVNEGYAKLYAKSSGADSVRAIIMRLKPSENKWYLVENMLLGQIRIPANLDKWA